MAILKAKPCFAHCRSRSCRQQRAKQQSAFSLFSCPVKFKGFRVEWKGSGELVRSGQVPFVIYVHCDA